MLATVVLVCSALAAGPGAQADARQSVRHWQPRDVLTQEAAGSTASGRNGFAIGTAADGTAVAVWERDRAEDKVIELSRRAPGGPWSEPLVAATVSHGARLDDLVVAGDGSATFSVDAVEVAPGTYRGLLQTVRPDGRLGPAHETPSGAMLVGNDRGDLMAIFGAESTARYIVRPDGGRWSEPAEGPGAVPGLFPGVPRLSMDARGDVRYVAPYGASPGGDRVPQIGLRTWSRATGRWSGVRRLAATDHEIETLEVAGGPGGDLVLGWADVDDDQEGSVVVTIRSAFVPAGGTGPRPVKTWARQDHCSYRPDVLGVGVDAAGTSSVAFTRCRAGEYVILTARRGVRRGGWGTAKVVTESRPGGLEGQVAVNRAGTTMIAVRYYGDGRLAVLRRPAGDGAFGRARFVTPPEVAVSARWQASLADSGDATVAYRNRRPPLYARSYEAGRPRA